MNIFDHIKLLKTVKLLLLIPLIGLALNTLSVISFGICAVMFIIVLFDFIMIDKGKSDYDSLYHSAYYDSLTDIPNRLGADLFVARYSSPDSLSVIIADLDGLKVANDTFGHYAGDILIKNFATLFFQAALPDGFAARNGGDEFLAIFPNDGNGFKARVYCEKLRRAVVAHNITAVYPVSYSIGYACSSDGSYDTIQQIISTADDRMYEEKKQKKQPDNNPDVSERRQ